MVYVFDIAITNSPFFIDDLAVDHGDDLDFKC